MALVARYHRRATPKREHEGYGDLDAPKRRTVAILAAFLRLAETLDRSRHGVIRGLDARLRLGELRINVKATGDAELELWAATRQAAALEEALGRRVRIERVRAVNADLTRQKLPRNSRRLG